MAVEENRIHFRKLVQTLQWTFLMLLSVQHNLSKTQTVLFTLVSGVTCLYVGLLGLRLRAGVVWRGRGRGSSCPALTLLATVCTAHVRHVRLVRHVRHAGTRVSSPGVGDLELRCDVGGVMSRVTSPHLQQRGSVQYQVPSSHDGPGAGIEP